MTLSFHSYRIFTRSVLLALLFCTANCLLGGNPGLAQDVPRPPAPTNDPGDPPILPPDLPGSGGLTQGPPPPVRAAPGRGPAPPPNELPPGRPGSGSPNTNSANGPNAPILLEDAPAPGNAPMLPGGSPAAGGSIAGGAPILGEPSGISVSVALVPGDDMTSSPELIIEAGGFLGPISDVAISNDSRLIAATGDKVVRIIDSATGTVINTLRGDRSRTSYGITNCVEFSPDGQFLLVGVSDDRAHGSIRVYRLDNLDEIHQLLPGHDSACEKIAFSRDGQYMATVDGDGQRILWDWPRRSILKKIPAGNPDKPIVDVLQFADSEPYLLSVEHDGPHVYRVPDGKSISASEYMPPKLLGWMSAILRQQVAWPFTMARSPRCFELQLDRNKWAAAGIGSQNGRSRPWVAVWPARKMTNANMNYAPSTTYLGHTWEVFAVAISPQNDFAVSGDKFGEIHIWDAQTGTARHKIVSQGQPIYDAAFSVDNDQIAFGTKADVAHWGFNSYGQTTHVLDLKHRVIQKRDARSINIVPELIAANGRTVQPKAPATGEQSYHMSLSGNGRETQYRLPSGRIPSCYTLLNGETLGVQTPVLYSDNLGFLAMWNTAGDELRRAYRGHESMVTSISPSTNGKVFVTGSTDRTIRIWSLLNHKPTGIFDFKYENTSVISVRRGSSSANVGVQVGDRIVSVEGHKLDDIYEMMLYNRFDYKPGQSVAVTMKRGENEYAYKMTLDEGFDYVEPLLNVFIGDNDQWIIWTPQGYYDCSPGADQLIGWHVNQGPDKTALFFQAQQFRKQLYRPDIINQVIETGAFQQAEDIANKNRPNPPRPIDLNSRDTFAQNQPPTVKITSPVTNETFDDPRVTIEASVLATNNLPITRVTLLHNGTPAKVFRPDGQSESAGFDISHRLRLFPGRNEISFVAENSVATSSVDSSRISLNSPAAEEKSKVFVLAIGIGDYALNGMGVENLKYAADDAAAFAEAVKKHGDGRLYSSVESKLLQNASADRAGVLDGLQWLVDNVKPGDVVMLFCSGHGFLDDRDNFYLGTHEVDPDKLRSTAVSWREVTGILHEELPACKRIVFLDACHADGIGTAVSANPLHDLAAPEMGTVFYASCTMQQKSFENDEWQHGAFTRAILDVINDKSADVRPKTGDGLVSTLELAMGVIDKVSVMTGNRQNPVVYSPDRLNQINVLEFEK